MVLFMRKGQSHSLIKRRMLEVSIYTGEAVFQQEHFLNSILCS